MPDMLARFWRRSQHAERVSLEREALDLLKAKRRAEKEDQPAMLNLKMEIELDGLVDQLLAIEDQK